MTKYIRSQCDKGRIVDSRIVGSFFKNTQNNGNNNYVFIPNEELVEKAKLKLIVNLENQLNVPKKVRLNSLRFYIDGR